MNCPICSQHYDNELCVTLCLIGHTNTYISNSGDN